ncbi:MAG: diguanylate cyclase [Sulfurimonas sp.]|jgi:diguanylate cyclase (GGDEF)-like protein/PAS domain S-box-containing protein
MSKWYSLHIKNEILLWFFIVSILPLLFLSTFYFINLKSDIEVETKKHLEEVLDKKANITQTYVDMLHNQLDVMAMLPKTKELFKSYEMDFAHNKSNNVHDVNSYFEEFYKKYDFYDVFLINTNGDVLHTLKKESDLYQNLLSGPLSDSALSWVFQNSKSTLNTQMSTFEYYEPSNAKASFISMPLFDGNKMLGIIAIQISETKLFEKILNYDDLGQSGEIVAGCLDKDFNVVSAMPLRYFPNSFKENLILQSNDSKEKNTPIKNAVLGNYGASITTDYRGIKVFIAWKHIPSLRWGMSVKIDYDEIMQPLYNKMLVNALVLFFVVFFISLAIILVTKRIIDPIETLITRVRNISKGEVKPSQNTQEIKLDNEIGTLAKSFSIMSQSLYDSQEIIKNYATELERKVEMRTQELENSRNNLQETNEQMKKHLNIIDKYVITSATDLNGVITEVSEAFCKISGYSKTELLGKKHNIVRHPDQDNTIYKELWKTIKDAKSWHGEIKNRAKDGSYYWVDIVIAPTFDAQGVMDGYSSIRQDITDKKHVEELSVTDQLTKLFNRLHLDNIFKREIQRAKRYQTYFSVILLDIDHFKFVNDTYGHDIGDDVLVNLANILKQDVRSTDILGRWGGEEFLIILPQTEVPHAVLLGEKLRVAVESHIFATVEKITCSFGVSQFKAEDESAKEVVKRADNGLYEAKNSGRNRVVSCDV